MAQPPAQHMHLYTASGAAPVAGPTLFESLRRALRAAAGPVGDGLGTQGLWYACCFPNGFSRVLNQAESDEAVIGTPGATRRGYNTFDEAQLHADLYAWQKLPRALHLRCDEVSLMQQQVCSMTQRVTAFSTRPLKAADYPQGPPECTVTVTPLNFVPYVQTPSELIALVGNCRVRIAITRPLIRDGTNINTADLDLRGTVQPDSAAANDGPGHLGSRVLYGQHRENGVDVWAETIDGRLSHVIPFSTIHTGDGSTQVPPLEGAVPLVPPARYVPRRKGFFYWAVLQGANTGIFYATVEGMTNLLPALKSVARACLTLEEATAFFFEELDEGFVLTEIAEGRDGASAASTALEDAAVGADARDMRVLDRALHVAA